MSAGRGGRIQELARELASWPAGPAGAASAGYFATDGGPSNPGAEASLEVVCDTGKIYPWASVSKLLTALTVLVLVQRGQVSLDEPAGPPGATVRHLLAHTSGWAFGKPVVAARPGRKRIYSNAGYVELGRLASARTGTAFEVLCGRLVLRPLDMRTVAWGGSPAEGAFGSLRDLIRLARELAGPTRFDPLIIDLLSTPTFGPLPGVLPGFGRQADNAWGLGAEVRDHKEPHWTSQHNSPATFGHFGQRGSLIWVDPVRGRACVALTGARFGPWAAEAWPRLADLALG